MGRQAGHVAQVHLHAHEGQLARALDPGPLPEGLEQRAEQERSALVLACDQGQGRETTGGAGHRAAQVHGLAHERENRGDAPQAIAGRDAADQGPREGHEPGLPGQGERETVQGGRPHPGAVRPTAQEPQLRSGASRRR